MHPEPGLRRRRPVRARPAGSPSAGWARSGTRSDDVLGRAVAVKMLRARVREDDAVPRPVPRRGPARGVPDHPGIAASSTTARRTALAYLVMELVEGEPLSAIWPATARCPPRPTVAR